MHARVDAVRARTCLAHLRGIVRRDPNEALLRRAAEPRVVLSTCMRRAEPRERLAAQDGRGAALTGRDELAGARAEMVLT